MADRFRFDIIGKEFKMQSTSLMREIAMANKNYFLQSFKRGGWGSDNWQEVDRRIKGTKAYEYPKSKGLRRRTRPILVGKGSLRRAVNSSVKSVLPNRVKFEVDLPYAAIHNEGLIMRGGKAMPQRQYMGENAETNKLNKSIIQKYAGRAFNK
jgi:phage gpG-like protein